MVVAALAAPGTALAVPAIAQATPAPSVVNVSQNPQGIYANTPTPTLQLSGIANDATKITLYKQVGQASPVAIDHYAPSPFDDAHGTATIQFESWFVADANTVYWVTQTAGNVESSGAPSFGLAGIYTLAPTVVDTDFDNPGSTDTPPTFYGYSGGNNSTFGIDFTLAQNGQTLITSGPEPYGSYWGVPSTLASGTYSVTAVTVDAFGDLGTAVSQPVTFTVAATTPTPAPTPTPTPTPIPTPTPSPTPTPGPAQPPAKLVTVALRHVLDTITGVKATTVAILKNDGFSLGFKAPSAGTVTIKWYATVKGKKTLIGSVTKEVGARGEVAVKVKLDDAGRKLLTSTRKSIKISESGSFTPTSGKQTKTSKTLTLKHHYGRGLR